MFFGKKSKTPIVEYHPETQKAMLKCSICNGEQVAGFKDVKTGKFTEVTLVRNKADLDRFMKMYGLTSIEKVY